MIILDTTVLVYSVGEDHRLREPCRDLLSAVSAGLDATTTPEVIQEFLHVRSRRRSRSDATTLAEHFVRLLAPLTVIDERALAEGIETFRTNDRLGAFDAVLASVARRAGASLASADRAFGAVSGLSWLDPAHPNFLADAVK